MKAPSTLNRNAEHRLGQLLYRHAYEPSWCSALHTFPVVLTTHSKP